MGWAAGSDVMRRFANLLRQRTVNEKLREGIYRDLISILQDEDWDTENECYGVDSVLDEVLNDLLGPVYEEEVMKNNGLSLSEVDDYNFEGCDDCHGNMVPEVVPPGAFEYDTPISKDDVVYVEEVLDDGIARDGEGEKIYIGRLKNGRWFAVFSSHDYSGHG